MHYVKKFRAQALCFGCLTMLCHLHRDQSLSKSGRSLINKINSNGPRIEPCGTPYLIVSGSDRTLFI